MEKLNNMNNKTIIGSIIAVAILILVSFTSVVGYNSVESNKILSPLFNVRSDRAVNKEGKDITCDYVGKGEESVLSIPKRDNRTALLQRFIDIIIGMDDATFNRFLKFAFNQIQNNNQQEVIEINEVKSLSE